MTFKGIGLSAADTTKKRRQTLPTANQRHARHFAPFSAPSLPPPLLPQLPRVGQTLILPAPVSQPTPLPISVQPPSDQRLEFLARHLLASGLAILPTETVYGLAASSASANGLEKLRALLSGTTPLPPPHPPQTWHAPHTWHAPSAEIVMQALEIRSPLHKRLFQVLTPGPVRFIATRPDGLAAKTAARIVAELGCLPGAIDSPQGEISVRIPDATHTRDILARVGVPIVMERVSAVTVAGQPLADARHPTAADAARAAALGIEFLDLGPTRLGVPSTTIRLLSSGGYSIITEGAMEEKTIRRKVERVMLMVCTGNTCRSPMARAIAEHALATMAEQSAASSPGLAPVPTRVISAGVAAGEGASMTPEAREALREMGIDAGPHRAKALTREMLRSADIVFAMTSQHLAALRSAEPTAARDAALLDPTGKDVEDPIGGPLEDYRVVARAMRAMIDKRLTEIIARDQAHDQSRNRSTP